MSRTGLKFCGASSSKGYHLRQHLQAKIQPQMCQYQEYVGLDPTKPVFKVSDIVRLTTVPSATETRNLKKLLVSSLDMILSKKWITKALISLCRCTCWSGSSLFANPRRQVFSHWGPCHKGTFFMMITLDYRQFNQWILPLQIPLVSFANTSTNKFPIFPRNCSQCHSKI